MGEVFLARQTGVLDRLAILKSLRADLAQEQDFVEQFLDEARVAATLNHPNIVSIYDVGEWCGTYYIAMEYVPGEDLSRLWYAAAKAGVGLPFQVSVRVCYEAALGLDHAHKARDMRGQPLNVVHRDVSPQNIMVRGDGVVKLVDFGIAKAANKSSRTQAGMVKGKLQYMSPEQVRGEALDGRSDQFSLGVVLWEMCTGRRLFKAESEMVTLQKILQAPIPKPTDHVPGFPAELEATILRMLQREAQRRYKSLHEAAADLKGYLDRSALAGPETSVSVFVQQILGKELEERIADLTPMEVTQPSAEMPTRRPKKEDATAEASDRPSASAGAPTSAGPTLVSDEVAERPDHDSPDLSVRRPDGTLVSFAEPAALPPALPDEAPTVPLPPTANTVTRPVSSAEVISSAPAPDAAEPAGLAFSLGSIPEPGPGAWGSADIAPAVVQTRPGHGSAHPVSGGFTIPVDEHAPTAATASGSAVPTIVWTLGGIMVALAVVIGGLAGFRPDVLLRLVNKPQTTQQILQAVQASRTDDPAVIDALLRRLEPVASAEKASDDDVAAAALLHLARARIDDQTARIAAVTASAKALQPSSSGPRIDAEQHRVTAYRLTTKALAANKDAAAPLLVLALYHGERGALTELDTEAARALEKARGRPLQPTVEAELAVARTLVKGRAELERGDAAALRASASVLGAMADRRAAALALEMRGRVAAIAVGAERRLALDDLEKMLRGMPPSSKDDLRTSSFSTLVQTLKSSLEPSSSLAVPTQEGTSSSPSAADAGPVAASSLGVDAGVVEAVETYESAMDKARKAQKAERPKDAVKWSKKALELKPMDATAEIVLGFALIDLPALENAARVFRVTTGRNPKNCEAQIGLAIALEGQGKTEEARGAYGRYLEICPNGKDAAPAQAAMQRLE